MLNGLNYLHRNCHQIHRDLKVRQLLGCSKARSAFVSPPASFEFHLLCSHGLDDGEETHACWFMFS